MFHEVSHPLIQAELTSLRDHHCLGPEFRGHVRRIASLMVPAVTKDFATIPHPCTTPLEEMTGAKIHREVVLAPVLRAGLGFLQGFLDLLPEARVAYIGLARNEETLIPEPYYFKAPEELGNKEVLVLEPMLATGGSLVAALEKLQSAGARRMRVACLVAAPEGVAAVEEALPEVPIYAAALDRCLNEKGYILPGIGDVGDRLFGT